MGALIVRFDEAVERLAHFLWVAEAGSLKRPAAEDAEPPLGRGTASKPACNGSARRSQ